MVSADRFVEMEEVRTLLDATELVVLSLDIEGEDWAVLSQFLELGQRPDVVVVEHLRSGGAHDALLSSAGYRHLSRVGFNDLYLR